MLIIRNLKKKGKERIKKNYLIAFLVCAIVAFFSGSFSNNGINFSSDFKISKNSFDEAKEMYKQYKEDSLNSEDIFINKSFFYLDNELKDSLNDISDEFNMSFNGNAENKKILTGIIGIIIVVILIATVISTLMSVFVVNVFLVGQSKFFLNVKDKPDVSDILYGFAGGRYWNSVKIMFSMNLKIFLWSLLFIIPGIIKTYEYLMIPYLLAEKPEISSTEAFAKSKEMMEGYKWFAFTLRLSFIGWFLLGSLLFGIGFVLVNTWVQSTFCEFYLARRNEINPYSYYNTNNSYDPYNYN